MPMKLVATAGQRPIRSVGVDNLAPDISDADGIGGVFDQRLEQAEPLLTPEFFGQILDNDGYHRWLSGIITDEKSVDMHRDSSAIAAAQRDVVLPDAIVSDFLQAPVQQWEIVLEIERAYMPANKCMRGRSENRICGIMIVTMPF